jgi:hypothetical protein
MFNGIGSLREVSNESGGLSNKLTEDFNDIDTNNMDILGKLDANGAVVSFRGQTKDQYTKYITIFIQKYILLYDSLLQDKKLTNINKRVGEDDVCSLINKTDEPILFLKNLKYLYIPQIYKSILYLVSLVNTNTHTNTNKLLFIDIFITKLLEYNEIMIQLDKIFDTFNTIIEDININRISDTTTDLNDIFIDNQTISYSEILNVYILFIIYTIYLRKIDMNVTNDNNFLLYFIKENIKKNSNDNSYYYTYIRSYINNDYTNTLDQIIFKLKDYFKDNKFKNLKNEEFGTREHVIKITDIHRNSIGKDIIKVLQLHLPDILLYINTERVNISLYIKFLLSIKHTNIYGIQNNRDGVILSINNIESIKTKLTEIGVDTITNDSTITNITSILKLSKNNNNVDLYKLLNELSLQITDIINTNFTQKIWLNMLRVDSDIILNIECESIELNSNNDEKLKKYLLIYKEAIDVSNIITRLIKYLALI